MAEALLVKAYMREGLFFVGVCGFILIGCGQKFPDYEDKLPQYEYYEGSFRGSFESINVRAVGQTSGYVAITARHNQFYARLSLQNHIPHIKHQQMIHKGDRCPDQKSDLNGDGIIDFTEVINISGLALLPLDGDLSSRRRGFDLFPLSDQHGKYIYSESASLSKMMQELRGESKDPTVYFERLEYSESLDLDKRVVIVFGDGKNDLMPIACAVLKFDFNQD